LDSETQNICNFFLCLFTLLYRSCFQCWNLDGASYHFPSVWAEPILWLWIIFDSAAQCQIEVFISTPNKKKFFAPLVWNIFDECKIYFAIFSQRGRKRFFAFTVTSSLAEDVFTVATAFRFSFLNRVLMRRKYLSMDHPFITKITRFNKVKESVSWTIISQLLQGPIFRTFFPRKFPRTFNGKKFYVELPWPFVPEVSEHCNSG
jgi:hypothetical protein